jgi:putative peptide zinc metalloprotease protein
MIGRLDSNGREIPASTCYLLSVPLDNECESVLDGATGQARIRAGTQSIGQRLWRFICQTFRFEL